LKDKEWRKKARRKLSTEEFVFCSLIKQGDQCIHNLTRLSRNALVTTDTELIAMAAPTNMGESSSPKAD
jgi:hypothetical protein